MKNGDLVVKYFPMAMRIARRFRGGDTDVLEGAALDGLIAAAQRYDRSMYKHEAFMAFAQRRIEGKVQDQQIEGTRDYQATLCELTEAHGSYDMLGLGFEIDAQRAVATLPAREQIVVNRLYFAGCTQAELAKELGLSFGRISQLNRQAIARIRKAWGLC